MTQYSSGPIDPTETSGSQLAAEVSQNLAAALSTNSGTARPSYVIDGMLWMQQVSSAQIKLQFYYGGTDYTVIQINPQANTAVSFGSLNVGDGGGGIYDDAGNIQIVGPESTCNILMGVDGTINMTATNSQNPMFKFGTYGYVFSNSSSNVVGTLDQNGNLYCSGKLTQGASDRRLKKNLKPVERDQVDRFFDVPVYSFDFSREHKKVFGADAAPSIGFMAQDLQAVAPEMVAELGVQMPDGSPVLSLSERPIIAMQHAALRALRDDAAVLRARLDDTVAALAAAVERLGALEQPPTQQAEPVS